MTETNRLTTWMNAYRRAWQSNDPDDIGALFSENAELRTEPFTQPRRGRDRIVEGWLADRDEPGTWRFDWHPLVETDDVSAIEATTAYDDGNVYSNLWVMRFDDDGRCRHFVEWYMQQPSPGHAEG